jgi:hypothetical protein
VVAAVLILATTGVLEAQNPRPREYEVKAAYLYGFGRFVEWPPTAEAFASGDVSVCVLGEDPFGRWLDEAVLGTTIKDRPVVVRRIVRPEEAKACHTVFVSASEDGRLPRILQALAGKPVLTVGETPQFAERGGVIGFVTDGARIRFNVNLAAAQASGLVLQSELLRVAASVLRGR